MKKLILLIAICCLGSISAFAQSTQVVNGAVIDNNGNPLPGAVVEATGGAESTVVDADGTFSIEVPIWLKSLTAKYAGMETQKKNLNGSRNVIFTLNPKEEHWFVDVVGAFCIGSVAENCGRVGLMGGYLGNWGGYAKVMPSITEEPIPSATLGVIKRATKTVYPYLGIGYSPIQYEDDGSSDAGLIFEAGAIIKVSRKINLTFGYSFGFAIEYTYEQQHGINVGVGYCF